MEKTFEKLEHEERMKYAQDVLAFMNERLPKLQNCGRVLNKELRPRY